MNAQRKKAEALIYKFFDAIDPTKANSAFYKEMFSKMNDDQFKKFCERRLPFRLQVTAFTRETNPDKIIKGLKAINVPVLEKVTFPSVYTNKDGVPVTNSNEAIVGYLNLHRLKQINTLKGHAYLDIDKRDPKSGRGLEAGIESDREFESLVLQNMDATIEEISRSRADDMQAKAQMYNQINTTGQVSLNDIKPDKNNQVARNTVDVFLIGSGIMTNLVEEDYMTPYTLSMKKKRIEK